MPKPPKRDIFLYPIQDKNENDNKTPSLEDNTTLSQNVSKIEGDDTNQSPSAIRAISVFDSFDKSTSGSLSATHFEALVEELGEGFHGDELAKQLSIVDSSSSGEIQRKSFVDWYQSLVNSAASKGEDASESIDSEEESGSRQNEACAPVAQLEPLAPSGAKQLKKGVIVEDESKDWLLLAKGIPLKSLASDRARTRTRSRARGAGV